MAVALTTWCKKLQIMAKKQYEFAKTDDHQTGPSSSPHCATICKNSGSKTKDKDKKLDRQHKRISVDFRPVCYLLQQQAEIFLLQVRDLHPTC